MKFLCGSCRTKYQISDDKVRGKILTIRCKKCGAKILVRESLGRESDGTAALAPVAEPAAQAVAAAPRAGGSAALDAAYEAGMERAPGEEADDMPTSIAPVPADAGLAGYEWYVAIDGQQHGPFAFAELVSKVERGDVVGRHYVWHDGMSDWTRVRDLPDLATYLENTKALPPLAEPVADSGDDVSPFGGEAEDPAATEADIPVAAAVAAADGGAGSAAPLESTEVHAEALPPAEGGGAAVAAGTVPEGVHLDLELGDDDMFAKIPRASKQELVQRESTKFFVAAAGVKNEKKKNRLGIIFAGVAALVFAAFMGLWAGGIIHVSLPGLGNPFRGPSETTAVVHDTSGAEGGDLSFLAEGVKVGSAKVRKARRRRPRRAGSASDGDPSNPLDQLGREDYVDSVDETDAFPRNGARGESAGIESATVDLETGRRIEPSGLPEGLDPSSNPLIPPPDVEVLDAKTIKAVVSTKKASVRLCYERSLKAQENLEGKLQIGLVVAPNGRVQSTEILSPSFKGTVVGSCIRNTIRNWRFPAFAGGDQEIELPFVFQRGG